METGKTGSAGPSSEDSVLPCRVSSSDRQVCGPGGQRKRRKECRTLLLLLLADEVALTARRVRFASRTCSYLILILAKANRTLAFASLTEGR
jgi:hypothetical protein